MNLATSSRSLSISLSLRSFILVERLMPAASQIFCARVRPNAIDRGQRDLGMLVVGNVDPAIRAIDSPRKCENLQLYVQSNHDSIQ